MKRKYLVISIIIFAGIIIGFSNISYASTQHFHSIDFATNLNEDGSIQVTELWDITINKASTASKEFIIDKTKFGEIEDVSVKEITQFGEEKNFENINMEMSKVTPDCYYALINSRNNFEIAWGTGLENSGGRKKYKISYTVTDVIKTYNDCNEFCWKFIGTSHNNKVDKVTGEIYLPENVKNIKNLRAWGHGNLNGRINIDNSKKVSFEAKDIYENESIEIRIAILENMFDLNFNRIYIDNFDNILLEEQQYASEANLKRETSQGSAFLVQVVAIFVLAIFVKNLNNKIKKEKKELNKTSQIEPTERYQYFRELPSQNLTAGDIGFIYYHKTGEFRKHLGKIFSANILRLHMKKHINISKNSNGDLIIEIIKNNNKDLKRDELEVLNVLTMASKQLKSTFTMKDFNKYLKNMNSKKMFDRVFSIENTIENNARNNKIYILANDRKQEDYKKQLWKSCLIPVFVFIITNSILDFKVNSLVNTILAILLLIYIVLSIINILNIKKLIFRYSQLTQKGTDYYEKIQALKRYIEDYSFLKDKETTDIELWRDYLVCAVILGISKKAIKEIIEQIPDFVDDNTYYFDYLYMDTLNISNTINNINNLQRFKDTVNSDNSSGEGYGGGFSDGDAGGGRRWKLWRKISKKLYKGEKRDGKKKRYNLNRTCNNDNCLSYFSSELVFQCYLEITVFYRRQQLQRKIQIMHK